MHACALLEKHVSSGHSVCLLCGVCALAMFNAVKAACISVKLSTLVSLQKMTEQRDMLQISSKAELDKKFVSITVYVCKEAPDNMLFTLAKLLDIVQGEAEELQATCSELKNSLDGKEVGHGHITCYAAGCAIVKLKTQGNV